MKKRTSMAWAATAGVAAGVAFGTPVAAQAGRLLTGQDLKNGTVASVDVANGSLRKKDFAAGALPARGEQGPAGAQGPSGIVATAFQAGPANPVTNDLAFIAPVARAVVGDSQVVSVVTSAALGGVIGSNGARDLVLDVCYREVGGVIAGMGSSVSNLSAAPSFTQLVSLAGVEQDLPQGVYDLGLCGRSSDADDWSTDGGGQTSVQVFKVG